MWMHSCEYTNVDTLIFVDTLMWMHSCGYTHVNTLIFVNTLMWIHSCGYYILLASIELRINKPEA